MALALQQHARGDQQPAPAAGGWVFAGRVTRLCLDGPAALKRARGRPEAFPGRPKARKTLRYRRREGVAGITKTLVEAMEAKDPYIKKHLRSVSDLALRIGREIALPEEQMDALANGALLHDVGKIGIPDSILQKSVSLTEEEYTEIKQHPALGVGILTPVEELASALPAVEHHHERFDGKGYPDGLRGEDIPLIARIVTVADAFDSMIRARPYGYGVSSEAALKEIEENSGTQFDPRIVARC